MDIQYRFAPGVGRIVNLGNMGEDVKMLKIKLTAEEKEKICNGLNAAGEWISEVAEKDPEEDGDAKYEPHIQKMLDAIDKAYYLTAQLKIERRKK